MSQDTISQNDNALESAIKTGLAENPQQEEETTDTEETQETSEETESGEETETTEEEISEQELQLLKQIRDPKTRIEAIKALATAEKLIEEKLEEKGEKPQTSRQVAKTRKEIMDEILGEDAALLPDKFLELLDVLIDQKLTPLQEDVVTTQINETYNKLASDPNCPGFVELESAMNSLVADLPRKDNEPIESYMRRLYRIAKAENPDKIPVKKTESETERKVKIRITRNVNDPQLKGTTPERETRATKALTLEESIRLAQQDLVKKK